MNDSKKTAAMLLVLIMSLVGVDAAIAQGFGGMMGGPSGGWGRGNARNGNPISIGEAKVQVEKYLDRYYRSDDLEVLEIMEFDLNLYALVGDPTSSEAAMELLVDPYTGAVYPEYGPNMMWNTEFGMMGGDDPVRGMMGGMMMGNMMGGYFEGMMGESYRWGYPGSDPEDTATRVTADDAVRLAQEYLDRVSNGVRADTHVTTLPGYYTLHTLERGKITGMLSVNAYDGAVWFHGWHGAFKGEEEYAD